MNATHPPPSCPASPPRPPRTRPPARRLARGSAPTPSGCGLRCVLLLAGTALLYLWALGDSGYAQRVLRGGRPGRRR